MLVLDAGAVAAIGRDAGQVRAGPDLATAWQTASLNAFLALGRPAWTIARAWLTEILTGDVHRARVEPHLHPLDTVTMHLPIEVADYVDFYASEDHASNVGKIFRPDNAALPPNWKHLPIGYHGRSGTVVVSGTDVVRPTRSAQGAERPRPGLRPEHPPRHRGRAGLRRWRSHRARDAGLRRRGGRPPLRRRHPQRLECSRHPGVGVRSAGPLPRQVLRDVDLGVGHASRRAGAGPAGPSGAGGAGRPALSRRAPRSGSTSTSRSPSTAPSSPDPSTRECTGHPPDARAPDRQRRIPAQRRPLRLRHRQRSGRRAPAAACSSSPGTARSRSPSRTARRAASSRMATP